MTHKSILVLVVSPPGPLQDGLLALMTTIPQINTVLVAEEANTALRIVENHQPVLVIIEYSTRHGQKLALEINTRWPQIQLILIVEDHHQEREAQEFGVENVLHNILGYEKIEAFIFKCQLFSNNLLFNRR